MTDTETGEVRTFRNMDEAIKFSHCFYKKMLQLSKTGEKFHDRYTFKVDSLKTWNGSFEIISIEFDGTRHEYPSAQSFAIAHHVSLGSTLTYLKTRSSNSVVLDTVKDIWRKK